MKGRAFFLAIMLSFSVFASCFVIKPVDATNALAGFWKFDEGSGTYAYDTSGNNNTGTLINGTQWVDGSVGKGLKFDGIDDFLNVPSSSSLVIHGNQLTVEMWIKPAITLDSNTNATDFLNKGNEYALSLNHGNGSINDGKIRFDIGIATIDYFRSETIETTTDIWMANTWYHVAGTYDGNSLKIYVNGVLENSRGVSGELWTQEPNYAEYPLSIGAYTWMDASPPNGTLKGHLFFFDGTMDEVKIYNYARSAEEIKNDCNAGNLVGYWKFDESSGDVTMDSSGRGNNGTLCNGPIWVNGRHGKALSFDGASSYVRVEDSSSLDVTSQVTVEAWVNPAVYVDNTGMASAIISRTYLSGGHIFMLSLYPYTHKVGFSVNPVPNEPPSSADIQLNVWTHLAMTYDGANVRLYINGEFDSSYYQPGPIQTTSNWLAFGCIPCGSYGGPGTYAYFNGTIDDVRIYRMALSQEDIYAHSHDVASSDEFCDPSLEPMWTWVDPKGDCSYNLTANPGCLRISVPGDGHDLYPYRNYDAPRVVQSVNGDFAVQTRVMFDPQYWSQGAGLLVWENSTNYLRLDRLKHGGGNVVCLSGVKTGSWANFAETAYGNATTYLMLERTGDTFNARYSSDWTNWAFLGSVSYSFVSSVDLGLYVLDEWQNNSIYADFDYFRVEHVSSTRYSWPMFRGDLGHTGYSRSPAPTTNQTRWNYTTGNTVASSPVVADNKVYFGSSDCRVYCLDAYNGSLAWSYTAGSAVTYSPTVAEGKVYMASLDGRLYCLDALSGANIWNYTIEDGAGCSPTVAYGRVYFGATDNKTYCLDASTGSSIWNFTTGGSVGRSPAIAGSNVYFGSEDCNIYCLNMLTGSHIWNYATGNWTFSSPAVVNGKVYSGSYDHKVYCLDAYNGSLVWSYTTAGTVRSSAAVADGKVYIGSSDCRVYCLDALSGTQIWNHTTADKVLSSPAIADGKVYVGSLDGRLYCLNASNGLEVWSYVTGEPVSTSPAVADGMVFIGSGNNTYAFGNVVRVPEDCRTVQEAINAATPDTTIWVAPGTYTVSIVVNKTVTIIGKKGSAPIFHGGGSGIAITLVPNASGSIITGVVITDWDIGIFLQGASGCKIYDNSICRMNYNGIVLEGTNATENAICFNFFEQNTVAINLTSSSGSNNVSQNVVSLSSVGMNMESGRNTIIENTLSGNEVGVEMKNSNDNKFYHNNFVGNTVHLNISMSSGNVWDDGYPAGGNYWSSHVSIDRFRGPGQDILGSDGIVDVPYVVAADNVDNYPLTKPHCPHNVGIARYGKSKSSVAQSYLFRIDVKIQNFDVYSETITLTVCLNATVLSRQMVSLTTRDSAILTFSLNTTSLAKGNYRLSFVIDAVSGETDRSDNDFFWAITVTIPGDIKADFVVDIYDAIILANAFNSNPNSSNWNPNADINSDYTVDIYDAIILANHYNQH